MKHLFFLFVDHFEPKSLEDVETWVRRYPEVVAEYRDADGRLPRHTWFYDGDDPGVLDTLGQLCRAGFGEIELHLHHGHDTADSLREKLEALKRRFGEHGALITRSDAPRRTYGFIHGKWSLDNSRGDACCGVNNEITILKETGCYADFTFPAWGRMQPAKCNSIYYATDAPEAPKSYDTGTDVATGMPPSGDLMIFQGPGRVSGVPRSLARIPGLVRIVDRFWGSCAVEAHIPPWPARVRRWAAAGVRVQGRPDWIFVKVHAHGALPANMKAYFDRNAAALHDALRSEYKEDSGWKLHYVTAREAYNLVKAAEIGLEGEPKSYRDFDIPPYQNCF